MGTRSRFDQLGVIQIFAAHLKVDAVKNTGRLEFTGEVTQFTAIDDVRFDWRIWPDSPLSLDLF